MTWVGHSTMLLQMAGLNILTDPVWSTRVSPIPLVGPRRWVRPAVELDALPPIDVVLLSHNHYDHCDLPTIRHLARRRSETAWFAPLGLAPLLRGCGVSDVIEMDWWQSHRIGDATIVCTPAQHFSARGPFDRDRTLWCSFAVQSSSARLFFGGDSALHPEYAEISRRHGPFDVVILPVGAYEPRWFMRPVHMNPEDAVQAYRDLAAGGRPPAFIPVHWGTFRLTDEPMDEPPVRLQSAFAETGTAREHLNILVHGETRSFATAVPDQVPLRRS